MTIDATLDQLGKQFEQVVADYILRAFARVLLHPLIPLDNVQVAVSRNNALRRKLVHPVQDRGVEQRFLRN
jgi:hypothetical protein